MGLELSAFELGALSGIVQYELHGWYVNNVYPLTTEGLLIRFHRSEVGNKNLAVHPRIALWLTARHIPEGELTEFCRLSRTYLVRFHLASCGVIRGERIVAMEFEYAHQRVKMYVEFFGAGNIIITDYTSKILAILRQLEGRERKLKVGLVYELPRPRKTPLEFLKASILTQQSQTQPSLTKLLGNVVQLPERIIREVVSRSGIPENSSIEGSSAELLVSRLREVENEGNNTRTFYLYQSDGKKILSSILLTHLGNPIGKLEPENLDLLFSQYLFERAQELNTNAFTKLEREQKRIESARKMHESTLQKAKRLKEIAELITSGESSPDKIAELLSSSGSSVNYQHGSWYVEGRKKEFKSLHSLASELFSESKRLAESAKQVQESINRMEKELRQKETILQKRPEGIQTRRKKRRWFDNYRWFVTSESLLAMGGRDAGSNSLLIRKKLEKEDLVFHAEVKGSPFFILKHGKRAGSASLLETATGTVCFSRAWREGLRAADAYYVEPSQVRLGAPSGLYMPKGSFMIEGQRNYVKDLSMVLGVGVTRFEDELIPCSGPTTSLLKYSPIVVQITPGSLKPFATANKIIKVIGGHLQNAPLPEVDEFVRILPPGDSDIVGIKKGERDSIENMHLLSE